MLRVHGILRYVLTTSPVGDRVVVDTWQPKGYAAPIDANSWPDDLPDDMPWIDAVDMCRDRSLIHQDGRVGVVTICHPIIAGGRI